MKKYLALLLLVLALPLFADFAKLGTSGAQFLKIGVGRGSAMGEAFVAIADDATASFWNPSGLGILTKREVCLQHNEWISDVRHDYLSVAIPMSGFGTLGVSLTAVTMGKMEYLTIDDPNTSIREDTGMGLYFNASDMCLGFSFGRMFTDRLSAGLSLKVVQEAIWNMAASGLAADFGIHYNTGFKSLRIAASMSNFGTDFRFAGGQLDASRDPFPDSPLDYEPVPITRKTNPYTLPLIFRFGLAFNPVETAGQRLTMALDLNHPNDNYETINLGFEYGFQDLIFLRVGYKSYLNIDYMKAMTGGAVTWDSTANKMNYDWGSNTEWLLNNLTAGVGFNLKMGLSSVMIDYGYMNKGVLKAVHRLGFTVGF